MSLYLTRAELVETTDYKRRDKQREALARMGIPFRIAPTGALKVLRSDLTLGQTRSRKRERQGEPDFEAL